MKTLRGLAVLVALFPGLVFLGTASANDRDARDAVFGQWAGDTSILEVGEANGALYARVISVRDPVYIAGEKDGPVGTTRVDVHNPDASLRSRPIVGIDLVSGYKYDDGKWQGQLYDPGSGKTYQSQMSVDGGGNLKLRGYIGSPMFGKTQTFKPVSTCTDAIRKMLAQASISNTCG